MTGLTGWIQLRFLLLFEQINLKTPVVRLRTKYRSCKEWGSAADKHWSKQTECKNRWWQWAIWSRRSLPSLESLLAHVAVFFTCARTCLQTHPFLSKTLKRGHFSHQTALGTLTAGCHITLKGARGRDQTQLFKKLKEEEKCANGLLV